MFVRMLLTMGFFPAMVLAQGSGSMSPPVALNGYCPVCMVKMDKLVKGSPAYSTVYDGKKYLFPSQEQKEMFDKDPAAFAPALGANCVVCKVELKKDVPGKPEVHLVYKGRLYLFPSEKQLEMFKANPEKYADADVALGGFCPVCKVDMGKDVKGKPDIAIDYHGRRYVFPSVEMREKFRKNPRKYAVR